MLYAPVRSFFEDAAPLSAPCQGVAAEHGFRTINLLGFRLSSSSRSFAANHIVSSALSGERLTVNFINAHCVNVARTNRLYRQWLARSNLLFPDGVGIEMAARMLGCERPENLNGTDLFPVICERAAQAGTGIYLLGGEAGVADAAAAWACANYPGLCISGTHHGFFDPKDENALIEHINRSGASILFVGFGVPLQEHWIARNRYRLDAAVVMGVGGLFDYYSNRIPRAPAALRALKGEWLWRLAMEPRRMAGRYLLGNAAFLIHAVLAMASVHGMLRRMGEWAKRAFDILIVLCAIIAFMPVFLVTALAIRMEDSGPALFLQRRVGSNGRMFTMVKFRSMYIDAEKRREALLRQSDRAGTCFKMHNDPRITKVGKLIRRLSIDELPQLFNVLAGSMSIVGPRPALPGEVVQYRGRQWERLAGKPGITCTWQVKGRAQIPFERQAIMDRAYLRRRSFLKDLRLIAMTVPAVVGGRGAY